jgi:hypothetical protein
LMAQSKVYTKSQKGPLFLHPSKKDRNIPYCPSIFFKKTDPFFAVRVNSAVVSSSANAEKTYLLSYWWVYLIKLYQLSTVCMYICMYVEIT